MARPHRYLPAGYVYHVGNRGSRRGPLFDSAGDFDAFERLVAQARELVAVRIIAYCLMFNHWHFLLWPLDDNAVSSFMHRLNGRHGRRRRWRTKTVGQGAVYQARFWAFPTFDELHTLAAWRYVERNPVEAGLVKQAEHWRWSSASAVNRDTGLQIDLGPVRRPDNWFDVVNSSSVDRFVDYFDC
jgi:putative transposase